MVNIQLATGVLEVKDGTVFPLNFQIGDIRDISKRKGNFSKTIKLIGSKNNHNLLNHYYDINIEAGTFNVNALTTCSVIQNDIPIMENVSMQLINIMKVQNTSSYEEEVEYEVLVKDSKLDFFTAINNLELTDIDFSDLNHTYDAFNVVNRFTNTVFDGFKYFLPNSGDVFYKTNEFKPAIFAQVYFDRIFADAGFQYNWPTANAAKFNQLIIPYNGEVDNFDYADYEVKASISGFTHVQPFLLIGTTMVGVPLTNYTEILDDQNIFDPLTGVYTTPFNISSNNAQEYIFTFTVDYSIDINNTSGGTLFAPTGSPVFFCPQMFVNFAGTNVGISFHTNPNPPAPAVSNCIEAPATINPGMTTIKSEAVTFTLSASSVFLPQLSPIDVTLSSLQCGINGPNLPVFTSSYVTAPVGGVVSPNIEQHFTINQLNLSITLSNNIVAIGGTIDVNDYVPKKIKQSDFVKGIFNMFNLYAEVDKVQPNQINLIHRDDFYDSGAEVDWSDYLAKDQEQQLSFLPELTSKKVILSYAPDKDSANTTYTSATSEIYGQAEVTFDNEYVKDTSLKSILFSPTPINKTPFGAFVPFISGSAPATNIRILLDSGVMTSCSPYNIYDYGVVGQAGLTSYPYVGHFDDPLQPTFDINFATCSFYYYNPLALTDNTLYNRYWRRTMGQINKGKMLTAMFNLREDDIQRMKLNDKIRIDNSWWNINRVIDYDANDRKLTKVELISVDNEVDFMPFAQNFTTPGIGLPNISSITQVANNTTITSNNKNKNVITGGNNPSIVLGKGNVVGMGVKALVVGDGNIVSEDGIVTDNLTVKSSINGVPFSEQPLQLVANITQILTLDPVLRVKINTFSPDLTFIRLGVGVYQALITNYTGVLQDIFILQGNTIGDVNVMVKYSATTQTIDIETRLTGVLSDDCLEDTALFIYYYP